MKTISLLFLIPLALGAQTTINGGRVFKGTLDASGAASTLPYRTGLGIPVGRDTCGKPGETYFQTDASAGQNVWGCTAAGTPGTWNQMTAGASVSSYGLGIAVVLRNAREPGNLAVAWGDHCQRVRQNWDRERADWRLYR